MTMARRAQEFQTIRSEGGLLPPDLLRRVIDPRGSLKGTRPEDYGLPQSERLNEVITQSWNRLRRHWGEFRAAAAQLPEGEAGTGLTNDKWSLPLLRELGFGLLPTSASPEIAGRTYAISRFFGSVPIHLVGCGLSLDRRAAGVRGAAGGNPHGLVQEILNRSPDHLWGIVANGLRLRVLRDNQALSRQSFLEFDLEAMFSAEAYSDFVLLWLVSHATRFAPRDGDRIETCWLEEWTKEAQEQGTRALKDLRGSVVRALQVLGEGFTSHSKNTTLREALRSGSLPLADFHGQLLRVVYRLIFLFVAEDRTLESLPLLHPRDESEPARVARERYAAHYGTARLRELAGKIKGSRHGDLWRQFQILVGALSGEPAFEGTRRSLELPALGSFLWSLGSTADLNSAELTNYDFLEALRHLAFTRQGKVVRPVDYRNLGAEELGGVYESLLALTPQISADGARFTFAEFAGNERKTSGSYYTPDSLVQCLLDSSLDPVVEEAIKGKTGAEAEQAILGLKVCDPAVGSGHFLVGAAHRLARHLARVRAQAQGESEPSPLLYQHSLRDVIGRCLYGVDVNPMAAELCRVSLWLEALEPGKPLSFLDHHIRVGDSLLGTTPELIAGGLPDAAFEPIEGDEKKVCAAQKKRNRLEREGGQTNLDLQLVAEPRAEYDTLTGQSETIDQARDDSIEAVELKADKFRRLVVSPEYRHRQQTADAWCAAFVWPKNTSAPAEAITSDAISRLVADPEALTTPQRTQVESLSAEYQFFHWYLAFPEVFARGGFDCVLGNPPWERPKPEPANYFEVSHPEIAAAQTSAIRNRLLAELERSEPHAFNRWRVYQRKVFGKVSLLTNSGAYRFSATGKFNLGNIFVELSRRLLARSGRAGLLNVSGLATDDSGSAFISNLMQTRTLVSFYDFENRQALFPEVHRSYKFSAITLSGAARSPGVADFVFFAQNLEELREANRHISYTAEDIALLNPLSGNCPVFRDASQAELVKRIYKRADLREAPVRVLWNWEAEPTFLFVMSDHSDLFATREDLRARDAAELVPKAEVGGESWLRLYESKMFHHFDHRWSSLDTAGTQHDLSSVEKGDPEVCAIPRYWMREGVANVKLDELADRAWLLAIREVTNATNERTTIAAALPRVPVGHNAQVFRLNAPPPAVCSFLANLNSFALDSVARTKVGGSHLSSFILRQLPLLSERQVSLVTPWDPRIASVSTWVLPRVLELTFAAWDLAPFARDCGWDGPPFRWDEGRRFLIRCELDAAFFHLYLPADADGQWRPARKADGCPHDETPEELAELKRLFPTPRDAVAYIMDTFPIVRRKDEDKYKGDYRTKRVILEIYDAMQEAMRTGLPYQTRLDPPPGPPQDTEGKFVPYAQIADNPAPHIHLPRDATEAGYVALQLSDLTVQFPSAAFVLRQGTTVDAQELRVRPVRTADIQINDQVVLVSPRLRSSGTPVPSVLGRLRVEARTDAGDGSAYVLVTVRSENGIAQARFSEEEWRSLKTVGVVQEIAEA